MENIETLVIEHAKACKNASRKIANMSTLQKNQGLTKMAERLTEEKDFILSENKKDVNKASENGLSEAMIDRLKLTPDRILGMSNALRDVARLADPVGEVTSMWTRPNGLQVGYMRSPLGVIAMIYESRPNVTSDAAGLCLKAGNAVFLRGGSEAFHSNQAITSVLHDGLRKTGIPPAVITLLPTADRRAIESLLKLEEYIDLVIPRGGEGLIRYVSENSRIPVIKHYKGVCHLFVDQSADIKMAKRILADGKLSRPGVCNALETLIVHKDIAEAFLTDAGRFLLKKGVELCGCDRTRSILPEIRRATDADYDAEYLALILAIKVVDNLEQALEHLDRFSSNHTDVIVTNNYNHAHQFIRQVDSSVVLVNASSRFSDGGELGLGAEIGISTTKLHAYGPMGLEALTTKKFIVYGNGQTRHNLPVE